MADPKNPVCFHCGQIAAQGPPWNTTDTGEVCTICRDRFLESLPSLLPQSGEGREKRDQEASEESADPSEVHELEASQPRGRFYSLDPSPDGPSVA